MGAATAFKLKLSSILKSVARSHALPHPLNLVGNRAAECCVNAVNFCVVIQCLFVAPSWSRRCNYLLERYKANMPNIKKLCSTRWSASSDAIKAFRQSYTSTQSAVVKCNDDFQTADPVRNEAGSGSLHSATRRASAQSTKPITN